MNEEEIRNGDIVEIDYIAEFTKEHINEGKALVIWKGFNHQPLVRKFSTGKTIWISYGHIARVIDHIDIERYMDEALSKAEIEPQESEDKDADKKCTYKETGCGSCKRQLDCPIEADMAESEPQERSDKE